MYVHVDQQCHGYKSGHQLLASTIQLSGIDQDALDRLSDISGPLMPGETFEPYFTAYPLPSSSFYVLARTWQDTAASRAGCVLTRSLILNMEDWQKLEEVSSLLDLLVPVERSNATLEPIEFNTQPLPLPPSTSRNITPLVEALFLEVRKPIVVFEDPEAEVISIRLLTSLWAGMRRGFSLSTLALSPRSIAGRSFDLVFAPKSARSRFTQWDGRIVDANPSQASVPRHRWTTIAVQHIFEEDPPSLSGLDPIGALSLDKTGEGSGLRIVLLWNELIEKSDKSPTAVLGLLDIANSRLAEQPPSMVLLPLIVRSIDTAKRSMSPAENLKFIFTLLGKFRVGTLPSEIVDAAIVSIAASTAQDIDSAIHLLREEWSAREPISKIMLSGVGDGLATLPKDQVAASHVGRLSSPALCMLLAHSPAASKRLMSELSSCGTNELLEPIASALRFPEVPARREAIANVAVYIRDTTHLGVLDAVLHDVPDDVYSNVICNVGRNGGFNLRAFHSVLASSARTPERMVELRSRLVEVPRTEAVDRLISATVRLSEDDVRWALSAFGNDSKRRIFLLKSLIESASNRDIRSISSSQGSAALRSLLREGLPDTAMALAKILVSSEPSEATLVDAAAILPLLNVTVRHQVAAQAIGFVFSSASVPRDLLEKTLEAASQSLDSRELVARAIPRDSGDSQILRNLSLLEHSSRLKCLVVSHIVELSRRLIENHTVLSHDTVRIWMNLLSSAGEIDTRAQLRAAGMALTYAFERRESSLSGIIAVAFPLVYAELRAGKEAPGILSFFFTDWDRCKTARRDLVAAFLDSNWSPIDFLRASITTGDLDSILGTLLHERKADSFLKRLRHDLESSSVSDRIHLSKALTTSLKRISR